MHETIHDPDDTAVVYKWLVLVRVLKIDPHSIGSEDKSHSTFDMCISGSL